MAAGKKQEGYASEQLNDAEPRTYRVRGSKQRISEAEFAKRIRQKEKEIEMEERRKQGLPFALRFSKFRENVIQKPNNNFLAFVTLVFTLATFFIVVSRQVVQADVE